ncbi:unnamed protein product [Ceutorhynchus assimilis]|uniref:C2H2-type domain-containing protein n=1 Tax=Ceutorhynchus assimilis TaxID=467358 RepID=A0A9N9MIR8_9CUCU|nr:unnamed protein product [Ceutorhynchus assimilis]
MRSLHKCDKCCKKFYCKTTLEQHISTYHDLLVFPCPVCEKPFKRQETMLKHKLCHCPNYQKPQFPCDVCDSVLSTENSYKKHKKSHEKPKPTIICNVCGKTIFRENFTIHMRRHTGEKPFRCDLCEAAFIRSSLLTEHLRTHTNEKPYECTYCQKKFFVKTALNTHLLAHKGVKPYECELCLKRFYQRWQLRKHRLDNGHIESSLRLIIRLKRDTFKKNKIGIWGITESKSNVAARKKTKNETNPKVKDESFTRKSTPELAEEKKPSKKSTRKLSIKLERRKSTEKSSRKSIEGSSKKTDKQAKGDEQKSAKKPLPKESTMEKVAAKEITKSEKAESDIKKIDKASTISDKNVAQETTKSEKTELEIKKDSSTEKTDKTSTTSDKNAAKETAKSESEIKKTSSIENITKKTDKTSISDKNVAKEATKSEKTESEIRKTASTENITKKTDKTSTTLDKNVAKEATKSEKTESEIKKTSSTENTTKKTDKTSTTSDKNAAKGTTKSDKTESEKKRPTKTLSAQKFSDSKKTDESRKSASNTKSEKKTEKPSAIESLKLAIAKKVEASTSNPSTPNVLDILNKPKFIIPKKGHKSPPKIIEPIKQIKSFYCNKCGSHFEDFEKLHEHLFKTSKTNHTFRCANCQYLIGKTLVDVTNHINKFCSKEEYKVAEEKCKSKYYCERCGKECSSLYKLERHYEDHENEVLCCSLCSHQATNFLELLYHFREHTVTGNIKIKCNLCPLKFYATLPCKLHYYTVHSHIFNVPYECDLCFAVFFDEEEKFLTHVQGHCKINKKHKKDVAKLTCEVCAKVFDSFAECKKHKTEGHNLSFNEERPCPQCNRLITVSGISSHLLMHQKEKAVSIEKNKMQTEAKVFDIEKTAIVQTDHQKAIVQTEISSQLLMQNDHEDSLDTKLTFQAPELPSTSTQMNTWTSGVMTAESVGYLTPVHNEAPTEEDDFGIPSSFGMASGHLEPPLIPEYPSCPQVDLSEWVSTSPRFRESDEESGEVNELVFQPPPCTENRLSFEPPECNMDRFSPYPLLILDEVTSETPKNEKLVKSFYCHRCGRFFATFFKLHFHILKYSKHRHRFRCAVCKYTVGSGALIELLRHIKKFHSSDTFKNAEDKMVEDEPEVIRYYCASCGKGMRTLYDLLIHDKDHQGDLLCCDVCPKQTATLLMLMTHYQEHSVLGHIYLPCHMCSLEFYHPTPLKFHYYTVHKLILNIPYECDLCLGVLFDDEERFLFHVQAHSRLNTVIKPNRPRIDVSKLTCEVCARVYDTIAECNEHRTRVHQLNAEGTCPICQLSLSLADMSDHLTLHTKRKVREFFIEFPNHAPTKKNRPAAIQCTEPDMEAYVIAKRIALGLLPLPVAVATKKAKKRAREIINSILVGPDKQLALDQIAKTNPIGKPEPTQPLPSLSRQPHPPIKSDPIEPLPSTSKQPYQPRSPIRLNLKSGRNNVKCTECDKSFAQTFSLNEHMKEHVLEKASSLQQQPIKSQMKCTKCDKSFTLSIALKKHMEEHALEKVSSSKQQPRLPIVPIESGPTRIKCTKCDKSFISSVALKKHMKEHVSPMQNQPKPQIQMNLKSGPTQMKCTKCDKSFTFSILLKEHMKEHILPLQQSTECQAPSSDDMFLEWSSGIEPDEMIRDQPDNNGSYWVDKTISHVEEPIVDPNSIDYIQYCYGKDTPYSPK